MGAARPQDPQSGSRKGRHIPKSKYQPSIAVQTHNAPLLPSENTTGNANSLFLLKIILQRTVHQLDIIRHGFVQIDKFLHLTLRDDRRTVRVIVRHQILARKHSRQNKFQLIQRSADKQPAVAFDFFLVRQSIQFPGGTGGKGFFHYPGGITTGSIFLLSIGALLEAFPVVRRSIGKYLETKVSFFCFT